MIKDSDCSLFSFYFTVMAIIACGSMGLAIGKRGWQDDLENNRKIDYYGFGTPSNVHSDSLTKHNLCSLNNFERSFSR